MDELERSTVLAAAVAGSVIAISVRLLQLMIGRLRGRAFRHAVGWPPTSLWMLGFGGIALGVIGMASIGVFVLPIGLGMTALAAWRVRGIPEGAIGAALGTGALCLFIGLRNLGTQPCDGGPVTLPPGVIYSCGGPNGATWLPLAIVLVIVGAIAVVVLQRHDAQVERG